MLYLRSNLTFHELKKKKLLEVTKWVPQEDNITIKYLHQNGHVRTFVRVRNDDDAHVMFKESGCVIGSVYLYPDSLIINRSLANQLLGSQNIIFHTFAIFNVIKNHINIFLIFYIYIWQ